MLEWLVGIGAAEIGKAIFEQILKLGQAAAEDYVKDFFKGCLKEGVAAARPEVAKKAVAEALKAFLLIVTDELEDQELSRAEIRDRYDPALVQFVKDERVKPILGKAFEKDCRGIESNALSTLWQQSSFKGQPFPAMPEEFDWQRVGSEYLKKVRRIVRETPELRSLLETELLEEIAHNTAQPSPGFDLARYRDSLQSSYGHLKLYAIDSTDRMDAIKLWNLFIEQTVREALPPTRHELPLDLKRQLQAQGQLESDLSAEALEHYRRDYFQQPSQKVLAAIAAQIPDFSEKSGISQRAVILGDPGAGKSTLLQYLSLDWAESQTSEVSKTSEVPKLPLLIELREYAIAQSHNFLDFLHRGRGVDWQFDQQQLHQYLQEQPTRVMFDGLDEVFDRTLQATIIDDIIRFAHQYPEAQILITSRIIGYNPDRLQHAGFRHFTIQPLDTDEIHEFIDRWYHLAMGSDPDKERLKQRLKDAIAHSNAIQNLADNPLLLTMMAILNRRQELPRDRADLYDQASRVLLYHWDVDHKRLQLPMDAIGRREKQEMLRLIAYEMQTSEEGLKGNLITAERLTQLLTGYLREQGFSEPREKANGLIDQLRHRNWILCDRGADTYGFVHRTFLEYFCAVEIVNRFEKQRTLTFEQLRDEVFGNHWQDETWREVLKLIYGLIDAKFAGELIEFLIGQGYRYLKVMPNDFAQKPGEIHLGSEGLLNLLLASDCLLEASFMIAEPIRSRLLQALKYEIQTPRIPLCTDLAWSVAERIARAFPETFPWFEECLLSNKDRAIREVCVWVIGKHFHDTPEAFSLLKNCVLNDVNPIIRRTALWVIGNYYHNNPMTLSWLKESVLNNKDKSVQKACVWAIARHYQNSPDAFLWLKKQINNEYEIVRWTSVKAIARIHQKESDTFIWLRNHALSSDELEMRCIAVRVISKYFKVIPETFKLLCYIAVNDSFLRVTKRQENPRKISLEALLTHYPTHPQTLELLRDRAINDPDKQLRQWAQQQLKMQDVKLKIEAEEEPADG